MISGVSGARVGSWARRVASELLERVDRLERRDASPGRFVERVVGGDHAREQGVAADRRHLHRVELGAGVGHLLGDLVDVPVFHAVGEHRFPLAVDDEVADEHHVGGIRRRVALVARMREAAESAAERGKPPRIERLIAKDHHPVAREHRTDRDDGRLIGIACHVEPSDLRAHRAGEGSHLELTHGSPDHRCSCARTALAHRSRSRSPRSCTKPRRSTASTPPPRPRWFRRSAASGPRTCPARPRPPVPFRSPTSRCE